MGTGTRRVAVGIGLGMAAALLLPGAARADLRPGNLRCEYLVDPLGIDERAPRLSWMLDSRRRGEVQTAYQVLVASSREALRADRADLWDSGRVESRETAHVAYTGKPLQSGQPCFWKVRSWDRDGKPSGYSAPASWEMGLLQPADWRGASWIGLADAGTAGAPTLDGCRWIWTPEGNAATEAPTGERFFRVRLDLPAGCKIARATFLLTADDHFTLFINGKEAGRGRDGADSWRQPTQLDVARFLSPGANVLAISARNDQGPAGLIGRLRVEWDGAKPVLLSTGRAWKCAASEAAGWREPAFDDAGWQDAREVGGLGDGPWGALGADGGASRVSPYLRRSFHLDRRPRRARLYATALGWYRLFLNGKPVGEDVLAPGWTDYRRRVEYQTYDVTDLLRPGENVVGALLGDGWCYGPLGWELRRNNFGAAPPRLRLLLRVADASGMSDPSAALTTNAAWRVAESPVRSAELYGGETYDARLEQPGWDRPGFDDSKWAAAAVLTGQEPALSAQCSQGIRVIEELPSRRLTQPKPGVFIFDLGQNHTGWVRLKVRGPSGTQITLRFAEELKADGSVYRDNLRRAAATDTYILRGGGDECFEPHFTYHGFRYVEVTGYPGKPALGAVTGCVVHSAAPRVGTFECSNPMVNRLVQNIDWGLRANIFSVPTDCPQRDERLGWMGDAQAFAPTSCFLRDMAPFYTKWMGDIVEAQSGEGGFSDVSPRVIATGDCSPGWADAGIVIPWVLYQTYGDTRIVARHFDAMARYVELIRKRNPDLLWIHGRGSDFGDWVAAGGNTPREVIASAYFARDAALLSQMARAIGREKDAEEYGALARGAADAFCRRFLSADGKVHGDSQTAYALALAFGLVPQEQRAQVGARLVSAVERHKWHLSTGFLGTPVLLPALTETGSTDVAYRILQNRTFPSWGYMVEKGATTIWELWDSDKAGPGMNSRNHFAFGSVGEWLQRYAAGIQADTDAPGYRHVHIQPHPGGGLTHARATYESIRGPIESGWEMKGDGVAYTFALPANTTGTVRIAKLGRPALRIEEDGKPVWAEGRFVPGVEGITAGREAADALFLQVGSGRYALRVKAE